MENNRYTYAFEERESFISFFFNIAAEVKNSDKFDLRERPLYVSLMGDAESGKSLIALAFDMAFSPHRYPQGILHKEAMKADTMLNYPEMEHVYLTNRRGSVYPERTDFDRLLLCRHQRIPEAKIIFISNVQRYDLQPVPNYEDSFDSDLLDMAITVRREDDLNVIKEILSGFRRNVHIDVRKGSPMNQTLRKVRPT